MQFHFCVRLPQHSFPPNAIIVYSFCLHTRDYSSVLLTVGKVPDFILLK